MKDAHNSIQQEICTSNTFLPLLLPSSFSHFLHTSHAQGVHRKPLHFLVSHEVHCLVNGWLFPNVQKDIKILSCLVKITACISSIDIKLQEDPPSTSMFCLSISISMERQNFELDGGSSCSFMSME